MKCIAENVREESCLRILEEAEKKYGITLRKDIVDFLISNNGGFPIKDVITSADEEYEVRTFLSLDPEDKNYCIDKPLDYFLSKTKALIVPIGIDSGDNYYCVHNENGKVYYCNVAEMLYYGVADNLEAFQKLFVKQK